MPKNIISFEHMPEAESPVEFVYPDEYKDLPLDLRQLIEKQTDKICREKLLELIRRLVIFLTQQKNPKVALTAFLHNFNTDFVNLKKGDPQNMTQVAKSIGISKQSFHYNKVVIKQKYTKFISNNSLLMI